MKGLLLRVLQHGWRAGDISIQPALLHTPSETDSGRNVQPRGWMQAPQIMLVLTYAGLEGKLHYLELAEISDLDV